MNKRALQRLPKAARLREQGRNLRHEHGAKRGAKHRAKRSLGAIDPAPNWGNWESVRKREKKESSVYRPWWETPTPGKRKLHGSRTMAQAKCMGNRTRTPQNAFQVPVSVSEFPLRYHWALASGTPYKYKPSQVKNHPPKYIEQDAKTGAINHQLSSQFAERAGSGLRAFPQQKRAAWAGVPSLGFRENFSLNRNRVIRKLLHVI